MLFRSIVRRVGRMHIMPCASKSYIDTYGMPMAQREVGERHRIVMMYADQGKGSEYYDEMFPNRSQIGFMAMRTNVSTALHAGGRPNSSLSQPRLICSSCAAKGEPTQL